MKKMKKSLKMSGKRTELVSRIVERRAKLEQAAEELKAYFVGLDDVIDEIIRNMELWYVMPELLRRPVIINLWGMTGVGKTDLVRRLVQALNLGPKFFEIRMSTTGDGYFQKSINGILNSSCLDPKEPGILSLDEFQKFRTVAEDGREIRECKYQDLWTLLSDGKFSIGAEDKREAILREIFDYHYYKQMEEEEEEEEELECVEPAADNRKKKKKKKSEAEIKYNFCYYSAKSLKTLLRLDEEVHEIAQWTEEQKIELLTEKLDDPAVYDGDDYSKLLIFVAGNLDEAYCMSDSVDEADIDADDFYKFSLKINIMTIKRALKQRFKPEEIARLGNLHVIYPSLNKSSYEEIISRRLAVTIEDFKDKYGITIHADQSINDVIYRNGVFPAQGTRPLFSTIGEIFDNIMPRFLLPVLENGDSEMNFSYSDDKLYAHYGKGLVYSEEYIGSLDEIKRKRREQRDKRCTVAVHEAGHAVAHIVRFGIVPSHITCDISSNSGFGFSGTIDYIGSYDQYKGDLVMGMAGYEAEVIVFGQEQAPITGCMSDLQRVTSLAAKMVRKCTVLGDISAFVGSPEQNSEIEDLYTDIGATDRLVDNLVQGAKSDAKALIENNMELLKVIADTLQKKGSITGRECVVIARGLGYDCKFVEVDEEVIPEYCDLYDKFFDNGGTK
jgi:cell division protease FtsH